MAERLVAWLSVELDELLASDFGGPYYEVVIEGYRTGFVLSPEDRHLWYPHDDCRHGICEHGSQCDVCPNEPLPFAEALSADLAFLRLETPCYGEQRLYCLEDVDGLSRCGDYGGNGSEPRHIFKETDELPAGYQWELCRGCHAVQVGERI